ncbi:hypothetical protein Tco_0271829 [Tanacetum coccineum]
MTLSAAFKIEGLIALSCVEKSLPSQVRVMFCRLLVLGLLFGEIFYKGTFPASEQQAFMSVSIQVGDISWIERIFLVSKWREILRWLVLLETAAGDAQRSS